MVNTRKSAKSSAISAEKRKESMQSSKALAAKSKIPKSRAPTVKKASSLQSNSESLVEAKKSCERTTTEIPQSTAVDPVVAGSTQARLKSEVISSLPSTSASIPSVENIVLKEVVNVSIGEAGKSADCDEASRAVDWEVSRDVTGDVASKTVIGNESFKIMEDKVPSKKAGGPAAWRKKIHASGYVRPDGLRRKKGSRRAVSPRQCLAKISYVRGRLSAKSNDGPDKSIGGSEGEQFSKQKEDVSKMILPPGSSDLLKEATAKGDSPTEEDEELEKLYKDIDNVMEDLEKEKDLEVARSEEPPRAQCIGAEESDAEEVDSGPTGVPCVQTESKSVEVPEVVSKNSVDAPVVGQDDQQCDHMEDDGAQVREVTAKTASKEGILSDNDQDLAPLISLKKPKKDKGKKKVAFERTAKGTVQEIAKEGNLAGGADSSKKRKRGAPVPVSMDAGSCEVPSPEAETVPVGFVKRGIWFVSRDAYKKWSCVQKRKIILEKLLEESRYKGKEVVKVLKESDLFWTLDRCKPFNEQLVREAMANLPSGFGVVGESEYGVFFVRGRRIKIDPELINVYFSMDDPAVDEEEPSLEKVVSTITAGSVQWRPESVVHTADLSTFYSMLFFIAVFNWRPSTHRSTVNKDMAQLLYQIGNKLKFNLGRVMFKQIAEHATSSRSLHQICFPSLIYELIIHQTPDLKASPDHLTKAPSKFIVDHKLFKGRHVNDLKEKGKAVAESSRGGANMGQDERSKLLRDLNAIIEADKEQRKRINKLARALSFPSDDEVDDTVSEEGTDDGSSS